jgi:eukaryotic-like serine/threonine-protein kinase
VGSLYYMSPEQVKGGTVDARSDLYSLGVSFYEMVTGERPFKADSDYSLMTAQLQERPKPPSALRPELPVELNGIILHSMAKDPEGRFQSADEFRQALDSIRQGMPAVTPSVVSQPVSSPPLATSVFSGTPVPQTPPLTLQSPLQARMQTPAAPSVVESAKPGKGRGLYMALGAVIVLVVLVLAGLSFPRWLKTRAAEQKQSADQSSSSQSATQNSAGAASSSTTPDANGSTTPDSGASGSGTTSGSSGTPDSTKPSDASGQPPADSGAGAGSTATTGGAASSAGSTSGGAASSDITTMASGSTPTATSSKGKGSGGKKGKAKANTGSNANPTDQGNTTVQGDQNNAGSGSVSKGEPIEEVEQDVDQASSRANAASESLDNMRRQLSGQGLSLRGDIASSQELMKANLDKAHQALQNGDTKNARRYLGMAQAQIEKIEKFLGH